jgi:hypothetical protein
MQLADILRDELRKMPSGRMLPSVRTLMQTYELSDGTVKPVDPCRAFLQLCQPCAGRRVGEGIYDKRERVY